MKGPFTITVNGIEVPEATFRLEFYPVKQLTLIQRFPGKIPFQQFASSGDELPIGGSPEVEVLIQYTRRGVTIRCAGPVSRYYMSHETISGIPGDYEFLEIAYTSLEY